MSKIREICGDEAVDLLVADLKGALGGIWGECEISEQPTVCGIDHVVLQATLDFRAGIGFDVSQISSYYDSSPESREKMIRFKVLQALLSFEEYARNRREELEELGAAGSPPRPE